MKHKIFACILLMMGLCAVAQAQMSDDQVIAYVKAAKSAGKGETRIGQELIARGVTPAQIERLKTRFEEGQGSEAQVVDQSVGAQYRIRC